MTSQCIFCERNFKQDDHFVYDCGEVTVSFGYGSRFDMLGDDMLGDAVNENTSRAQKLASCDTINGKICDDCFEKKQHLFSGYNTTVKYDHNEKTVITKKVV